MPYQQSPVPYQPRVPYQPHSEKCVFCDKPHSNYRCDIYKLPFDRYQRAKSLRICYLCLSKEHMSSSCEDRSNQCLNCKSVHHKLLCFRSQYPPAHINLSANQQVDQNFQPVQPNVPPVTGNTPNQIDQTPVEHSFQFTAPPNFEPKSGYATPITQCVANITDIPLLEEVAEITAYKTSSVTILQTAQALVINSKYHGIRCQGNILMDTGSSKSFVTREFCYRLSLIPYARQRVKLTVFGSTKPDFRILDVVQITLKGLNNQYISISALVIPKVSSPLKLNLPSDWIMPPEFENLKFARDMNLIGDFHIDILIGHDFYYDIVNGPLIRSYPQGPVCLESALGYILSGPIKTQKKMKISKTSLV